MAQDIGAIVSGLALLICGAQALVRGASQLALALGVSPLVVGLTIVAFGTGAPELSVSIQSSLAGSAPLVLGNALGSTIYNVLFILGLCATITPLAVAPQIIRLDVPVMIACAIALQLLSLDGRLGLLDGSLLVAGMALYTAFTVLRSRKESGDVAAEYADQLSAGEAPDRRFWRQGLLIVVGLGLLGVGSDLLVDGAVAIARMLGVSETVIGLTIVTIGTTAPELSACLVAALKGERDIVVGNIVGSNIFNVLAVLGVGALVAPGGIEVDDRMLRFAMPVTAAACFACLPIFFAGQAIRRWEGLLFLAFFVIYVSYVVLEEIGDVRLLTLQNAVVWFVAPLTLLTLIASVGQEIRSHRRTA